MYFFFNISRLLSLIKAKKMSCDGASLGNPGKAGGGGVIRDCEGRWMRGFVRSIGDTTSIIAEFWALRDGLLLAGQLGVQNLVIELDAKVVEIGRAHV